MREMRGREETHEKTDETFWPVTVWNSFYLIVFNKNNVLLNKIIIKKKHVEKKRWNKIKEKALLFA